MKNLITILCLCSFLFSVGKREDTRINYTIIKNNSFTNIMGWTHITGEWFSEKNNISRDQSRKINLEGIDSYLIQEIPDILILVVSYTDGGYIYPEISTDWYEYNSKEIFIFDRNDIDQIHFKYDQLNQIKIQSFLSFNYENRYDGKTLNKEIILMLNKNKDVLESKVDGESSESLEENKSKTLRIDYYIYDNKIQYILSIKDNYFRSSNFEIPKIGTRDIKITKEDKIGYSSTETIQSFIDSYYFESPFDEFKKIFLID